MHNESISSSCSSDGGGGDGSKSDDIVSRTEMCKEMIDHFLFHIPYSKSLYSWIAHAKLNTYV